MLILFSSLSGVLGGSTVVMEMCTCFEKHRGHCVLFKSQCPWSHHCFYPFWLPSGAKQGKLGEKRVEPSSLRCCCAEIGMASVPSTICLRWGLQRTDSWKAPPSEVSCTCSQDPRVSGQLFPSDW